MSDVTPCRECSECDGHHHFCDAMRDDDGNFQCKHCEVTTPECEHCGEAVPYDEGEPTECTDAHGPLCPECAAEMACCGAPP